MPIPKDEPRVTIRLDDDLEKFLLAELARRGLTRQDFLTRLIRHYRAQPNMIQLDTLGQLDPADRKDVAELRLRRMKRGK